MKRKLSILLVAMFLPMLLAGPVSGATRAVMPSLEPGRSFIPGQLMVMMCEGPVYYCKPEDRAWHKVQQGQTILHGYSLRTAAHGYLVLSWSSSNMIMVKPESGLRVVIQPQALTQLVLQLHNAELMLSARDSGLIEAEGRHGSLMVNHGDSSIVCSESGEIIRAVKGQAAYRMTGRAGPALVPESYSLEVAADGSEKPLQMFDPASEYDSFKRFANWLQRFDSLHRATSSEVPFQVDSVKVNGQFISNLNREGQFHILETPDGKVPQTILLQLKLTPYPGPSHRFELYLGKDLVYALREGRDDYFEVNFALPSIPEFIVTIHQVDSLDRRVRIFSAGFTVANRRAAEERARRFCRELSDSFSRRDQVWLRNNISRDFRDWQGNTWFDFLNMSEETLRRYRDIRLTLHPFRFEQKDGMMQVHLNYRLSALTGDWKFRFEDRGSDIYTLKAEDGRLKLYAKVSGMFFNRLKVAVDLRQGILRGRVTDERTRMPVSGVSVTVRGTTFHATTDSMGEYVIYNMPPGRYDLKFYKNGYGELTATTVTLKPAGETF